MSLPAFAAALAVSAAAVTASRPPPPARVAEAQAFPSIEAALDRIVASAPKVLAFGELHETTGNKSEGSSTLGRFTDEVFPHLAPGISQFVVETWISTGRCGTKERAATDEIARTTDRPASTENEIIRLLETVKRQGATPRILTVTCDQYASLFSTTATVDYDGLLKLTAKALGDTIVAALKGVGAPTPAPGARERDLVIAYGGALHNDVHPGGGAAPYSFAPLASAATLGRYVEVDVVDAQMLSRGLPALAVLGASAWMSAYRRAKTMYLRDRSHRTSETSKAPATSPTIVIRRSDRSFVLILR